MDKNRFLKSNSLAGKIIAFAIIIVTVGITILSVMQAAYTLDRNFYTDDIRRDLNYKVVVRNGDRIISNVVWDGIDDYRIKDSAVLGARVEYNYTDSKKPNKVLWQYGNLKNIDKQKTEEYRMDHFHTEFRQEDSTKEVYYNVVLYISKDVKPDSEFYLAGKLADWMIKTHYTIYLIGAISAIIAIIALIYLLSAVGHKKETDEISGSSITKIPIDLYTGITTIVGIITIAIGMYVANLSPISPLQEKLTLIAIVGGYVVCTFISLLWLIDMAVRIKMGKWWRNSIVYKLLKLIVTSVAKLMKNVSLVWKIALICVVISFLELIGILIFSWELSGVFIFIWFIEKVVLFAIFMAVAVTMKKLQVAGEKISNGNLEYQVDTSKMYGDFKKHGENLNQIGQGLNLAVDEKLKSERMKTELITNVSHDIKTPLTSIINYSDLISKEDTDNENIKEYSEVLNRQSVRLKRLIEDLVEASKASTGNLEVNLEPTEVGVMLEQTEGEYEDKLSASNLTLVVSKPEEPVYIMADGRRLWRVMDNILNNVCKYAMPGTRVYLNLEKDMDNRQAIITLKNVSREALDISPEELLERFVQGDKARRTEGNGLGLSIANSLTELQKGTLKLEIDGDLFKVTLKFPYAEQDLS